MLLRLTLVCLIVLATGLMLPARAQMIHDMTDDAVTVTARPAEVVGKRAQWVFASQHVAGPYNGVALQGATASDHLEGAIRFRQGNAWSDWQPLYLVRSATADGTFLAAYRGTTYRTGTAFELRFTVDAAAGVSIRAAGVFDNRRDADQHPGDGNGAEARPDAGKGEALTVLPPVMTPRSVWGAEGFRGSPVPLAQPSYNRMTFHHAAGFGAFTFDEGLAQVKAIQDFHQNGRGWSDIGYHFVVDQNGRVYQGRPFLDNAVTLDDVPRLIQGAHVGGANTGNIGVCLLGCYHPPETAYPCNDVITPAALDTMVALFAFFSEAYGVDPDDLLGHRDQGQTACPGDNNYALLPEIREDVIRLKLTGNLRLGQAELTATTDADGVARLAWTFTADNGIAGYRLERTYRGQTTVLLEGEGAAPDAYADPGLTHPGVATYDLYVRSAGGREQRLVSAEVTVELPSETVLSDTYPNPFAGRATIRYYLQQSGIVTVAVYDGTGRTVQTLVDTYQEGEQWYTAPFDGGSLAGGVYYYRIQVEGFAGVTFDETKTLVLVR